MSSDSFKNIMDPEAYEEGNVLDMKEVHVPFHRPSFDDNEIQEVIDTLRSGWITSGPRTKRFESAFATYVGASHAIAVNSGTSALHLSLLAIGVGPGDEVIVPTNTFTATAEAVTYLGARPVLTDVRRDTFNLDEVALQERITSKTKAVIPVHIAGQPCNMKSIMEIADARGLKVVEDAAHALPAKSGGRTVGTIGDITAFSFYANKTITTGEGGMITTEDGDFAKRMRLLSLHGISHDAWKRYTTEGNWYYEVTESGYKYNMSDIAAAIGIHQLAKSDSFRERRREIAARYDEAFKDNDFIRVPVVDPDSEHAWLLYIILVNVEKLGIDRAEFIEELKLRNVHTSVHFIPLHLHPYYQSKFGYMPEDFPNAEWVYDRCISLPLFPDMTDEEEYHVIDAVIEVAQRHKG